MLGPLADNGGLTFTHALLPGSPAIDAGDPLAVAGVGDTPLYDQRGAPFGRVVGGRIDIGAYAVQPAFAAADFDEDGNVDGDDLRAWQSGFGIGTTHSQGDADGDTDVDGNDFLIWQASFATDGIGLASGGASAGAQLAALLAPGAAQEGLGSNSSSDRMLPLAAMAVPPVDATRMSVARPPMRFVSVVTPPTLPAISPQAADAWATTLAANAGTGRLPYAPRPRASLADVSADLRSATDLGASRFAAEDARDVVFAEDNDRSSLSHIRAYQTQR